MTGARCRFRAYRRGNSLDAADASFGLIAESFGCRGLPLWVAKAGTRARRATAAAFKSARPSGFDAGFSLTHEATRFALGS